MVWTELCLLIFWLSLKTVYLRILLANSCQKNSLVNDDCKKTMVYIILEDIESNSASDWLQKASLQLVTHSLAPQARMLQSIDELFLVTRKRVQETL